MERKVFEDRVEYRLNGKLHRDDGPAVKWNNGDYEWYNNGQRHRIGAPACVWNDTEGSEFRGPGKLYDWYLNGKLSRIDGPAIEYSNGDYEWFLNGKRHRIGGPALRHNRAFFFEAWYINGKLHSISEPAMIRDHPWRREVFWYLYNSLVTKEVVKHRRKSHIIKSLLLSHALRKQELGTEIEKVYF